MAVSELAKTGRVIIQSVFSGFRCGGVFHPFRVWNHPHHLTPSCEPLQNHLEPPQCKPNTDIGLRLPGWLVSGSKVVSPVLFGW